MTAPPVIETWPLEKGQTLSSMDWFQFHHHRFLASELVAEATMNDQRAAAFTATLLWSEAMRQDPAGTLPVSDLALASLARFGSVADWLHQKDMALHGWHPVLVEVPETGATIERLGHPMIRERVHEMWDRKRRARAQQEARQLSVRKSRIRKRLKAQRVPEWLIGDEAAVTELARHFAEGDLFINDENLTAALDSVLGYVGGNTKVVKFPEDGK